MSIGPMQLILILLLVLVLFGAGKIQRVMRDMGEGIGSFKEGLKKSKHDENQNDA